MIFRNRSEITDCNFLIVSLSIFNQTHPFLMGCLRDRLPRSFAGPFWGEQFCTPDSHPVHHPLVFQRSCQEPFRRSCLWITMQLQKADSNPKLKPGHRSRKIVCRGFPPYPLWPTSPSSTAKLIPPPGGGPLPP